MSPLLTYNDMLGAYAPYPAPIRPYLLRAETHPGLSQLLTKSFMRVFIDVLGRAPIKNPLIPLKLRVDVVASDLGISTKTVSRAIRFLQNSGWLNSHVHHDGRNSRGEFCAKEFLLSHELRSMLGMPTQGAVQYQSARQLDTIADDRGVKVESSTYHNGVLYTTDTSIGVPIEIMPGATPCNEVTCTVGIEASQVTTTTITLMPTTELQQNPTVFSVGKSTGKEEMALLSVDKTTTRTKMSHGVYIGVNKVFKKEASFKEGAFLLNNEKNSPETTPKSGLIDTKIEVPLKTPLPQTMKQPRLPADLTEMAETLNLSPSGICALMRIAKQANQRLQDLWNVKRDQLINAGAKEGRAFRYIQFLLNTGEDFAFRARHKMQGKKQNKSPSMLLTATTPPVPDIRQYWDKKYIGARGLHVRIHGDGSAEVQSATRNPSYVCPRDMPPIYEAIQNNKLWLVVE